MNTPADLPVDNAAPLVVLDGVSHSFGSDPTALERLEHALHIAKPKSRVLAVDNVSLTIKPGEVVGLVGESGCGKSTLGRIVAGILEPSQGEVLYRGKPLSKRDARMDALKVQMIFQNPYASLNPRLRAEEIIGEAPRVHGLIEGDFQSYVTEQMSRAGLDSSLRRRFPHQFSGGQRQRIGIARALAVAPEFLVCDEAVAALDVSIQAQILNLFMDLRAQLDLTYLFISHDLGVVEHLSDRVMVMYLGRIVEEAPVAEMFQQPNHPYSQALLAEVPRMDVRKRTYSAIPTEMPSPLNPPSGCYFHPRCPHAMARCAIEAPKLKTIAANRKSACHLNDMA